MVTRHKNDVLCPVLCVAFGVTPFSPLRHRQSHQTLLPCVREEAIYPQGQFQPCPVSFHFSRIPFREGLLPRAPLSARGISGARQTQRHEALRAGTQAVCLGVGFLGSVRCHLPDSSSWRDCTDVACHLVGPAHPAYGIAYPWDHVNADPACTVSSPSTFKTTQPHLFVYVHIGRRGKEEEGGEKQGVEASSERSVFKPSQ